MSKNKIQKLVSKYEDSQIEIEEKANCLIKKLGSIRRVTYHFKERFDEEFGIIDCDDKDFFLKFVEKSGIKNDFHFAKVEITIEPILYNMDFRIGKIKIVNEKYQQFYTQITKTGSISCILCDNYMYYDFFKDNNEEVNRYFYVVFREGTYQKWKFPKKIPSKKNSIN